MLVSPAPPSHRQQASQPLTEPKQAQLVTTTSALSPQLSCAIPATLPSTLPSLNPPNLARCVGLHLPRVKHRETDHTKLSKKLAVC
jgi:hypothetical protein